MMAAHKIPTYRPAHMPQSAKERHRRYAVERTDKDTNRFYSSKAWRRCRAAFLAEHPLCEECLKKKTKIGYTWVPVTTAATVADHQVEIKDDMSLAYDFANLKALCQSCHNAKTGRKVMEARR